MLSLGWGRGHKQAIVSDQHHLNTTSFTLQGYHITSRTLLKAADYLSVQIKQSSHTCFLSLL